MNATIEKHLEEDGLNEFKLLAFNHIVKSITLARNGDDLRLTMIFDSDFLSNPIRFFEWGFGGSHLWVKEKGINKRLLIVEF